MKYLITEQQYNKAIDKFITYQLEPNKKLQSGDSLYWVKDTGEVVANIELDVIYISKSVWENLSSMFSLDTNGVQDVLKEWVKLHHGVSELEILRMGASPYISLEYLKNLD